MFKTVLALFLIAHGLVHGILAIAPDPAQAEAKPGAFFTSMDRSWLLPKLNLGAEAVRWVGIVLAALSTLGFVLTGLGIFGVGGLNALWRTAAVASACISLLLLILFWHRWLPVGVLIDVATLVTLLVVKWPRTL